MDLYKSWRKGCFFRQKMHKNPSEITFHYLTGQAKNGQNSALLNTDYKDFNRGRRSCQISS